jgi:hypothetical protein
MKKYLMGIHYCSTSGDHVSCRRVVKARDEMHAIDIMSERVHKWKRYMGKLDMDCSELREGSPWA